MKELGIYIHIPFCYKKCGYCSFNSFDDKKEYLQPYLTSVQDEIIQCSKEIQDHVVTSIFFGGGTPTFLSTESIEDLLILVSDRFSLAENVEISMEANPVFVKKEYFRSLHATGINRLSFGVQSFRNELLTILKRDHSENNIISTINSARKSGIDNISLDLMFGIPTQRVSDWVKELHTLIALSPEHVSTYNLTLEEDCDLFCEVAKGNFSLPDEEEQVEMYEKGIELLTGAGYVHYEISNFSKHGYECSHNRLYWENRDYLGVGPGACSYVNGERRENHKTIESYICSFQNKKSPVCFSEVLSSDKKMRETIFMNLRLLEGVNKNSFRLSFGNDMMTLFGVEIESLVNRGLLINDEDRIRLTRKGVLFSNTVFMEFV